MTQIKKAVGESGFNDKIETTYIQILLNNKFAKNPGFIKLTEDGLCGRNTIKAIRNFQQTQAKIYHVDGRIDPDKATFKALIAGFTATELTSHWNKAVMTQNKGLITDEQAKRAHATSKPLPKKLVPKPDAPSPSDVDGFSFPLERLPTVSYQNTKKCQFDTDRGGRKHAGCDLHMPPGEPVYAMADGTIRAMRYFYGGTYALEIIHKGYIARYGELFPSATTGILLAKDILPEIAVEKKVEKGQLIGYIGEVYDNKRKKIGSMLHFELYSEPQLKESLTDLSSSPYKRRRDIMNPTRILDRARSNMPSGGAEKLPADLIRKLIAQAVEAAQNRGKR